MPADGETFLFTSESVNEGHPDKLCDQARREPLNPRAAASRPPLTRPRPQVSDAVLDACLEQDPYSKARARVAVLIAAPRHTAAHAHRARR